MNVSTKLQSPKRERATAQNLARLGGITNAANVRIVAEIWRLELEG
jgi:hypothetical protein